MADFRGGSAFVSGIVLFMDADQFEQVLEAEVGEGEDAVVIEAMDPDHAVFGLHFIGDFVKPVDRFTEAYRDEVDGRDVSDLDGSINRRLTLDLGI